MGISEKVIKLRGHDHNECCNVDVVVSRLSGFYIQMFCIISNRHLISVTCTVCLNR